MRPNLLDGAIGLFLLPFLWTTGSYGLNLAGHDRLKLYRLEPGLLATKEGPAQRINIFGTGLALEPHGYLVPYPLKRLSSVNPIRADYELPKDWPEGRYSVFVENGKGERAWMNDSLEIVWQPTIKRVHPTEFLSGEVITFSIEGNRFDSLGAIRLGPVAVDRLLALDPSSSLRFQPEQIVLNHISLDLPPGKYDVRVTNTNGREATLKEAFEISKLTPARRWVTCAATGLSPEAVRALRCGRFLPSRASLDSGRILEADVSLGENTALLRVQLTGEEESNGAGIRGYRYRGQLIQPGAVISIGIPSTSWGWPLIPITATVISWPHPPEETGTRRTAFLKVLVAADGLTPRALEKLAGKRSFGRPWRWYEGQVEGVSVIRQDLSLLTLILNGEALSSSEGIRYFYREQPIRFGERIQLFFPTGRRGEPEPEAGALVLSLLGEVPDPW
ncbi:MAG: hypothetical protein HYS41_01495 [Candidatus Omnitrophica bacterium]|nr:hypothetical protein [Candidatus Omnitrophota bacterium]